MTRAIASSTAFDRFAVVSTVVLFILLVAYAVFDPGGFAAQLEKDHAERIGAFEHLTVLVLLPGILAGLYASWRYRRSAPGPVVLWVALWSLACIYFAGEEASWGQWYFGWETPAAIDRLNDQGETNLHNMSSWLDQKPRMLVELFVVLAGVIAPALGLRGIDLRLPGGLGPWSAWIIAPSSLLPAGVFFLLVRIGDWVPPQAINRLGDAEFREFVIAWFLTLYLASYLARFRADPRAP